ncbi:MAG: tetratricopeptide repeat protein [Magnetococcales bacterium]|nr:tetratricopeptide repeat protein [Magnetococcales bacterium]
MVNWLKQGHDHHVQGRHGDAARCYRRALAIETDVFDAWNNLGALEFARNHLVAAAFCFAQAVDCNSHCAEGHYNLATVWSRQDKLPQAIAHYEYALALQPDNVTIASLLIQTLMRVAKSGAADETSLQVAQNCYNRVLALQPDHVEARIQMGLLLISQGLWADASACYQTIADLSQHSDDQLWQMGSQSYYQGQLDTALFALVGLIARQPDHIIAQHYLGLVLSQRGDLIQAEQCIRLALAQQPNYAAAWHSLGFIMENQQRWSESIPCYEQSVRLDPNTGHYLVNLTAAIYRQYNHTYQGNPSLDFYQSHIVRLEHYLRRAVSMAPTDAAATNGLAFVLREQNRFDEAIACIRHTIDIAPASHAFFIHAFMLLSLGRYRDGWPQLTWSWYQESCRHHIMAGLALNPRHPPWDGQQPIGKRLLLIADQGVGDSLLYLRYATLLAQQGVEVIAAVHPSSMALASTVPGVQQVCLRSGPYPDHDGYLPLLCCPHLFQTDLDSVPQNIPYLFVDARAQHYWQQRLGVKRRPLRVGLAWSSSASYVCDFHRSIRDILLLQPLFAVDDVEWISLQVGPPAQWLQRLPGTDILDLSEEIHDFMDTAAIISLTDLVICVDGSVAHVTGALGQPLWVLLGDVPDWRWLRQGEHTPWFPTARLFRQQIPGDWGEVITRLAQALRGQVPPHLTVVD